MFAAIIKGLKFSWRYKRVVLINYLLSFILALVVALPLQNLLSKTVGNSLMLGDIIKGFDYTFLNDFKNTYGAGLLPIMNQSILILGLYLLLFIFLTGGTIALLTEQPARYEKTIFWGQSAVFFGRIFRITFFFLLLHGGLAGLLGAVLYQQTGGFNLFALPNESTLIYSFYAITAAYFLIAPFCFLWQEYTKIILVKTNQKWVIKALWQAMKYILQNFRKVYVLYLFLFLFWLSLIVGNYIGSTRLNINSNQTVWIAFGLSQGFVMVRLWLKLFTIGSLVGRYETD